MIIKRPLALAIALTLSFTANANDAIEEIIVTANFRDTPLTKTAQSVSVISDRQAENRGAVHIESLLTLAPNIEFSSGSSRARFIQMRGVGDLEQYAEPKYYPSVGVVLDGFELTHAGAATTFDVSQIEVLRGPQGTRYGASAHAGLVKLTSNAPSEDFLAELSAGIGNYGSYNLGAVINGAIVDSLSGRLAIQQNSGDGFTENNYLGRDDTAGFDELTLRGALEYSPSEYSSHRLTLLKFSSDNGYDAYSFDNDRTTHSDQPGEDKNDSTALSLASTFTVGDGELTVNLSATEADTFYSYDADWASQDYCIIYSCSWGIDSAQESFDRSQQRDTLDIRYVAGDALLTAQQFNYVVGLYANSNEEDLGYNYPSLWYGNYSSHSEYKTSRVALYGEIGIGISNRLSLTSGVRAETFDEEYSDSNAVAHSGDESLYSAELSLSYESALGTVYATLAGAQKPGGTNVSASSQHGWMSTNFQNFMQNKLQFGSESLVNKELGFSGDFADGNGYLRAALFHTSRDNAQLENWMWDNDAGLWIGYLDSTSDATTYGVELESTFAATDKLSLSGSVGYLRTKVDSVETFDLDQWGFVTKVDRDQAKSPEYSYSLSANYALSDSLNAGLTIEGKGDSYYGYYHDGKLDSRNLVNGHITWLKGELELTFWGRNLTNESYATHALYFGADPRDNYGAWANETYLQLGEPRSYGVNARYSF